jgi:hypothetical protein
MSSATAMLMARAGRQRAKGRTSASRPELHAGDDDRASGRGHRDRSECGDTGTLMRISRAPWTKNTIPTTTQIPPAELMMFVRSFLPDFPGRVAKPSLRGA